MTHIQTNKGIKIIFIALIVLIGLGIISSFVQENLFRSMIRSRSSGSFSDTMETIDTLYDVFHIFTLLLMCLVLYGAYTVYKDGSGFSETHKQKTKIGLVFIGIWVVFSVFFFLRENGYLYLFTYTISSIAYAIGMYLLVMEIAPKFQKKIMLIGMIFIIASGIFLLISSKLYIGAGASSVLGSIGRILFIVAFVEIYFILTGNDVGLPEELTKVTVEKKEEDSGDIKDEVIPIEDIKDEEKPAVDIIDEVKEKEESHTFMDRILEDRTKELVINEYAEKFNISLQHAEVIFTSGYYKIEDLNSSSIEELLIIDEINPTIARKIVNYFKD